MTRREQHEDRLERMRLLYDLNKHITTLATGILLLMAGLFDKVFKHPQWKPLAAFAALFFAISVLTCLFAMFGFAMYSRATFRSSSDPTWFGANAFILALSMFILGVIAFTVFALVNI